MNRWLSSMFLAVLVVVCVLPVSQSHAAPNVLVITIDTLRADRLSSYGYSKPLTPVLDALAREGILFEKAFSPVPLTLPSHCSLFTGTYPPFHGVRDNAGFVLDTKHITMAEIFRSRGYRTAAFVGAFVLDSKFGLQQGFDLYVDDFDVTRLENVSPGYVQRPGNEVVQNVLQWWDDEGTRDFFAWVHLYDPHDPYTPPEPFRTRHSGSPYDGEVAFTDHCVGLLIEYLKGKKAFDDTLIVVVGDHGESLGDHGEDKHGYFIYNSTLHVPLIVRLPKGAEAGRRVRENVSLVDILPTVLQVLEIPRSTAPALQGRGLLSLVLGKERNWRNEIYAESYYPRLQFGWSELRALITGSRKLILAPRPELYLLDHDFGESDDQARIQASLANQLQSNLRSSLQKWAAPESAPGKPQIDAETLEKLQSLGYVGLSMEDVTKDDYRERADPKDQLDLYNRITDLLERGTRGEFAYVIPQYEALLKQQPQLKLLHFKLGQAYFQTGQYEKAIAAYTQAVGLGETSALASYDMALAYMKLGRVEEAILGFRRAVQLDPRHSRALSNLGVLLKNRGQLQEAEQVLRQALEEDPKSVFVLNNLGTTLALRKQFDEAETMLKKAISLEPGDARLLLNLATVYRMNGRVDLAEETMRAAKKLDPNLPFR